MFLVKAFISNIPLNNTKNERLTVILIASSADPDVFKELLKAKKVLQDIFLQPELSSRLCQTLELGIANGKIG